MNDEQMSELTKGLTVIAEKIRVLADAGCTRSEIARFLDIRYQHVHNVLKRSNRLGPPAEESPASSAAEPGVYMVTVERGGKVTLPPSYLVAQGISDGDVVVCRETGGGLQVLSRAAAAEELRRTISERLPGEAALLDALIRTGLRRS